MRKVSSKRKAELKQAAETNENNASTDVDSASDDEVLVPKKGAEKKTEDVQSDGDVADENNGDDQDETDDEDNKSVSTNGTNKKKSNKKEQNKKKRKSIKDDNDENDDEEDEEVDDDAKSSKKKRGRPGKKDQDEGADDAVENGKSKRGRKRKVSKNNSKKSVNGDTDDDEPALKKSEKKKSAKNSKNEESAEESEGEEYEVEAVVAHKIQKGVSFYQIRWKGFGEEDDTWEREDDLSCQDLIEKYNKNDDSNKKIAKPKGPPKKRAKLEAESDPEKEWEVEKVIDMVDDKRKGRLFRIRWKGFRSNNDTWEPEANLNCKDLIEKFIEKYEKNKHLGQQELRTEPKRTKLYANEASAPRARGARKSKRAVGKLRTTYYDDDE